MAVYTHNQVANSPVENWIDVDVTIQSITATEVVLLNTDGTLTVLTGTGFVGTTGAGGTLTSGTIAEAARTNGARTVTFETITGFSYAATAFSARLPETSLALAMADIFGGNDTLNGFSGNDFLRGFAGDDTISGGTGTNVLIGNAGNDTLIGGTRGNNALDVNVANYAGATDAIVATLGAISTVTGNGSVGTDTLISVERVRGSAFNDTLVANIGFSGQYGALTLFEGMGGNDTITGNGSTRVFFSQAQAAVTVDLEAGTARSTVADLAGIGIDTITGGVNGIHGSPFGDALLGSNATRPELFRGLAGSDLIDGRGGNEDLADYVGSPSAVNVDLQLGTAQDGFGTTDTLLNIEAVRGSEFDDIIAGNDLDNVLTGQSGDDVISGRGGNDFITGDDGRGGIFNFELGTNTPFDLGNDTIDGGAGTDTASYFNPLTATDVVADVANNRWLVSTPSQGTDTVTNVEIVQHGAGRFLLVGASGFATVAEAAAAATRPGDAILVGSGNAPASVNLASSVQDTAIVTGAGSDQVTLGSGDDTVDSGAGDDTVTSGAGNDVVRSGSGNDTVIGGDGTGDDIYDAGAHTDTVVYSSAVNSITVDLRAADRSAEGATSFATIGELLTAGGLAATTLVGKAQGNDIHTDALIEIENIVGGQSADQLTGNASANQIAGGAGNDSIDGDGGDDTLVLSGDRADYAVTGSLLEFVIADGVADRDGIDTVRNVEFVRFGDGSTVSVADLLNPSPVDQPPVADADGPYAAVEDTLLQVTAANGVLAGDTDPENGSLTAEVVSSTSNGTLTLNADGSFKYQPGPNFNGSDSFVYRARDAGGLASSDVTVQINVQAVNDAAVITGDTSGTITEDAAPNTVSGDLDAADVDSPTTFQSITNGGTANRYGTFTINAAGEWTYVLDNANAAVQALNTNEILTDKVTVRSADGTAAEITITIRGANEAGANVINGTNKGEVIKGTNGADIITALKGVDIVNARDGDDVIKASVDDGNDLYYGDGGSDTVDYSALTKAVEIYLSDLFGVSAGIVTGKQSGADILASIENVIGSQGSDKINGNDLANALAGGAGADTMNGRGGVDRIEGGSGNDLLSGGSGNDMFVFKHGFGNDRITDFDPNPLAGQDRIDLTAFGIASAGEFAERVKITDIGAHTLVTIDGDPNQTIRLDGIGNIATVTVDDFRFL